MSVIIRLQNLPWSANALDIRNFFRGLSIPEGGVHIVGGELGDAFIAFSTDEDARQAMMLDGGKIKEIQVRLLLSSRSEMHKVIETARQTVPILSLTAPAPAPAAPAAPTIAPVQPVAPVVPQITPFSAALGTNPLGFGIPGIGNPQEIPQPAVIEPPAPLVSPSANASPQEDGTETESKRIREKDRRRTRSRSRSRDRKDRKRDRRDRSRSRERRRRDRSRSRERRDRKRDSRKERSRSRERSPTRRSRDRREKNPRESLEKSNDAQFDNTVAPPAPAIANMMNAMPGQQSPLVNTLVLNGQMPTQDAQPTLYNDPGMSDAFNKLQELGKKRNPNAFQGDPPNGNGNSNRFQGGRSAGNSFRREGRPSRFETSDNARDVCVAIRNAPNHTSYGDVRRFFPFLIDKHGIKMINDNMGRRTGNIFVKFCDPRSKQLALQRRNNVLKEVQVTVESLPDDAYDAAVDSFLPYREDNDDEEPILIIGDKDGRPPQSVLKLTDLPNFVKEHDIIKSFSEFSLLSITLVDCRATRTKTAFVQFVKPEDAKQAYDNKDKYLFGRRHPTITPLTLDEFEKEKNEKVQEQPPMLAAKEQAPEPVVPRDPRQRRQQLEGNSPKVNPQLQAAQAGAPQFFGAPFVPQQNFSGQFVPTQFGGFPAGLDPRMAAANWAARPGFADQIGALQMGNAGAARVDLDDEPLDCVLMKGLPREATDRTIVNFLSDTGAVPSRIHLMLDGNGLPSGDCFCEFRATQEARMAATKHGSNLEGCRVTVDLVTRSVVEEALEGPKQPEPMNILGNVPAIPQYYEAPQSVPPRGGYMARGPYRGGRGGYDSSRGFDSNRGFDSSRGFDRGGYRGGFDSSRGNYRGRGGFERGGRGFERGRGGRGFGGRGRGVGGGAAGGGFEGRERDDELDPALEDFGAPGCVVSMENVPFRASIDDIMSFFSEFDLTQDDVIRRYNERGQPTGDARVAFRTPFDAQRAVKTRHMDTIHDRRITLTIL